MQPRSESLYNPSQSLWFRTIPKQSNLFTHTSFSLNQLVTWLPRFPILWITRQVNTAKHSRVLIIPETEKRLVPILVNDYLFVTSRISWISWDKTVTATPREIRDWGQIKLSSESSSQLNSRDKMTNLRLKAYRRRKIRIFSVFWNCLLRTTFQPTFIWHRSHELCPSAWEVPGQVRGKFRKRGLAHPQLRLSTHPEHSENEAREKLYRREDLQ